MRPADHRWRRRSRRPSGESGQVITVVLVLWIPIFFIAAAIGIDFGAATMERSQFQQAASLAAEAGASVAAGSTISGAQNGVVATSGSQVAEPAVGEGTVEATSVLDSDLRAYRLPTATMTAPQVGYLPAGSADPCAAGQTVSSPSFYVRFRARSTKLLFSQIALHIGALSFPVCAVSALSAASTSS